MRIQLLSDLHLETETYTPKLQPDADVLILAGDIDSTWQALDTFADWPVPVLFLPGNHEFDQRDVIQAEVALKARCESLGMVWLHRQAVCLTAPDGTVVRFVGATRWSDFDTFGPDRRDQAMKACAYFLRYMNATIGDRPFGALELRDQGLTCRRWLQKALRAVPDGSYQKTVVVTHFAPSLRSADPRYGQQPSTASFCNADDDLLPLADLWLHGHVHQRFDYPVHREGCVDGRVVCHARGMEKKGEPSGWDEDFLIDLDTDMATALWR